MLVGAMARTLIRSIISYFITGKHTPTLHIDFLSMTQNLGERGRPWGPGCHSLGKEKPQVSIRSPPPPLTPCMPSTCTIMNILTISSDLQTAGISAQGQDDRKEFSPLVGLYQARQKAAKIPDMP